MHIAKALSIILIGAIAAAGCSPESVTGSREEAATAPLFATAGNPATTPLIAGQHDAAGEVQVWNDATNIYVKFVATGGYTICETHVAVTNKGASFVPQKNGNPIPGKFAYKRDHDPCVTETTYTIPKAATGGTLYTIAAHAVVIGAGDCQLPAEVIATFPATANVCVTAPVAGGSYYFPTVTLTLAGTLNGVYGGWCVDLHRTITPPTCFLADVRPAVAPLSSFSDILNFPANLDKVNWILNQDLIGAGYTFGDIQRAIWQLVGGVLKPVGFGDTMDSDDADVAEIVALAMASGAGYTPGCGDYLGVVLDSQTGHQPLIVGRLLECSCTPGDEETAWGQGPDFPGSNWAMYFTYQFD